MSWASDQETRSCAQSRVPATSYVWNETGVVDVVIFFTFHGVLFLENKAVRIALNKVSSLKGLNKKSIAPNPMMLPDTDADSPFTSECFRSIGAASQRALESELIWLR